MKRFCTFFVILTALSCWISVANAQKPTIDIRIEPETPAHPTVGDTLNYLVVIPNSQNVIGFRLIHAIPLNLSETVSHATYADTEEQTGDSVDAAGRITGTWESSTRYPDSSIRYVAGFALNNVSAGAGEIRVTGMLRMLPGHGAPVSVDVSLPITISSPANAQIVNIPDPSLAAVVRHELDLAPNAPITKQALQRLTELQVNGRLDYREGIIVNGILQERIIS